MEEITRDSFHKLQNLADAGLLNKITGQLTIVRTDDGVVYKNDAGKWLRSYRGIYFAHPSLIKYLEKLEKFQ